MSFKTIRNSSGGIRVLGKQGISLRMWKQDVMVNKISVYLLFSRMARVYVGNAVKSCFGR